MPWRVLSCRARVLLRLRRRLARHLLTGRRTTRQLEWFDSDGTQLENNITSEERPMSDGKRFVVESTILLEPEARHNGANITCRAKNEALDEPQAAALTLHVKYPPEVSVAIDRASELTLLFDSGHSLDERIVAEQFVT